MKMRYNRRHITPSALLAPAVLSLGLTIPAHLSAALPAQDTLISADDSGYLARGREMLRSGNYIGTIDQLGRITTEAIPLTPDETEEWLYLLASAYFHTADPRCEELLNAFIASYPASARGVESTLLLGDFYFYSHNFSHALEVYNRLPLEALGGEKGAKYSYRRALSMVKCGFFDEARPIFHSLKDNKEYANAAKYYDAYIDYVQGDTESAMRKFRTVKSAPDGIEPQYYISQIHFRQGEWQQTIEEGERLLGRQPDASLVPGTLRAVGLSYYYLGELRHARMPLEEYVAREGAGAADDARYALAACLYNDGDLTGAQRIFSTLTDSNDAIAQGAYLYLGQIAAAESNPSSAAINFEKAYRMNFDPKVAEAALYNYMGARMRGGNIPFDNSMDLLQQFAERYPNSEYAPAVDRSLAEAYYSRGEYDKALEAVRRIRRPDAETLAVKQRVLYGAGTSAVTKGDYRRGSQLLDECVEIGGRDRDLLAQAYLWLGDARYRQEQYSSAERAYDDALKNGLSGATRRLAQYDLAYARLMQDKFKSASKGFAEVVKSGSQLPSDIITDARMRLADCKYYTGDYTSALADYSTLIKEGNSADYATLRQAQIMGVRGDVRGKIKTLEAFERTFPDSRWMSAALTELAETYTAEQQHDKAAAMYERIVAQYPDRADGRRIGESYYLLGTQLLEKGDRKGALEAFRNLERSGDADLVAEAYAGIMRSSDDADEQLRYARLVKRSGGLDAEAVEEASLIEARAQLKSHRKEDRVMAETTLSRLADNPQSLNGAKSAVALGEYLLESGRTGEATAAMEEFTASGSSHQYWVARGFIILADAYEKQGKEYLALEYLKSLKQNYPGKELDIHDMITKRIKRLEK